MSKKKKKYYVVWKGGEPGVYERWVDCQEQVKGYPGALYKAFDSREEAEEAFLLSSPSEFLKKKKKKEKEVFDIVEQNMLKEEEVLLDSWAVDAACSGNPGPMEYRGVYVADGTELFHKSFELGTNNVGEFLAIVHALALAKKIGKEEIPVYSDSELAMNWVKKGHCKTTLPQREETKLLFEFIRRAEEWLEKNDWKNPLLKWNTIRWGEIPADFGRK